MNNFNDDVIAIMELVERVAVDVHYATGMEKDDAKSLLILEVVERQRDYVVLWNEGQQGLMEKRLKGVAAVHARKERIKKKAETQEYFYDPEYVRLFLPFYFDRTDWDNGPAPDDSSDWATGEAMDTALDIQRVWYTLKGWQRTIIELRYLAPPAGDGGVDWDGIAQVAELKDGRSARNMYAIATRILTEEMNKSRDVRLALHEGPGSRTVISNSQANALISNN